jgi:hypothetical protein
MESCVHESRSGYQPKKFGENPLYRILSDYWESFCLNYEDRFTKICGSLRDVVSKVVYRLIDCGNPLCGFARILCTGCRREVFRPFSCKTRGFCPSCQARFAAEWSVFLVDELLEPVPHRHIIFTIPKILRPYFRYNRKLINGLSRAAHRAIQTNVQFAFDEPVTLGMIAVRQQFGEAARHHPHIHVLFAEGVWNANREFLPLLRIDASKIKECFELEVFRFLRQQGLLSRERMELIQSWRHSGFGVYLDRTLYPEDQDGIMRIGRYLLRAPIALERMDYDRDRGMVTYRTDKFGIMEIEVLDFIARLAVQVPDPYERLVVYYGIYCNSSSLRKQVPVEENQSGESEEGKEEQEQPHSTGRLKSKKYWAQLINRIFLEDPLLCPNCGGERRVISFITQIPVIDKILKHVGYHHKDPPKPKYRGPPKNCKQPLG